MMLIAGLLVVFTATVFGISSGNTGLCNAQDPTLGCLNNNWGFKEDPLDNRRTLVNRLNCTTSGRIMAWSSMPSRTDLFTVRSGREGPISSDVAFYHPNEYVTITVRATQYKMRYRGLMLYAVNGSGLVVGNFKFAPEDEAVPFWTPDNWFRTCGKSFGNALLHKNADEKPYTMNFRWKAPPAGSGAVVFKALFKSGPANDGDMWFPANGGRNDLTLSERTFVPDGAVPALTWIKAPDAATSCAQVCTNAGRSGVDTTLMTATDDGGDGFSTQHPSAADAYARTELCRAPFISSCAADSPGIDPSTSFCTFKPAICPSWRKTAAAGRLRMCACLLSIGATASPPCVADQGWPETAPGGNATRACSTGQTGSLFRACSTTGVWGTAVSTCVTAPTCSDRLQNQGEYGVDCGGPCPACLNCPLIACGTHGSCIEGPTAYCQCNNSWTGSRCEVPPPNPCDDWICANGATCQSSSPTVAQCLCVGAWLGIHCDELPPPTCTDGIKNQGEAAVDCGTPCAPCNSYRWDQGVWSECSLPCGGGQRTRGLTCLNSTGHVRPSSDCAAIHPPETVEACNVDVCPTYTWVVDSWDVCNTLCGGGVQTRAVDCWSSVGPVKVTTVGLCAENLKPAVSQVCNTAPCTAPRWVSGPWGACSLECGGGLQTRVNKCNNTAGAEVSPDLCPVASVPSTQQACNIFACESYDWFLCPNWGPCTATCGGGDGMLGQQYRDLFCSASDGKQVDYSLCDPLKKPKNVLTVCNTFPCSDFNWMATTDWMACNGTHRSRTFHCHAKNGAVATEKECAHVPLPIRAIPCTLGITECYDLPPTPYFGLSSAPKMQTSMPFVLAALSSMVASPRMGLLGVALLGLSFIAPAEAHNWLHTPGRASFQASTVAPCQARKESDLHAQVIKDQRFTIRFATGHERDSYFVSLDGADAAMLGHDNFEAMVDQYLAEATNEDHLSAFKRRYHGYNGIRYNQGAYDSRTDQIGKQYSGPILPDNPNYPNHTRATATNMYTYTDATLSADKRASYASSNPNLSWIISAARLPHLYHLPDDFDALHWAIPSGQSNVPASGHIIVHWRWSGYYDCIDVDLRSGTTSVDYPDGILDRTNHVWSQIDHCQYESPINIMTQCMEVIDTAQPCMNALGQGDWNQNNRYGLNVVPFRNPATVNPDFAGEVYIPWRNGACSSSWNVLPGSVSETQLDWATWLASKATVTAGQTCGAELEDNWSWDLKRAVGYCVGRPTCTGIAWENVVGSSVQAPGAKHFKICSGSGTSANAAWTLYRPSVAFTAPTLTPSTVYTINFSPASRVPFAPVVANMVTDAGYVDGYRTGANGAQVKFGWSCATPVDCEWCCSAWSCPTGQAPRSGTLAGCCTGNIDFTYMYAANDRCPNTLEQRKSFHYDVPNGVYEVTTKHQGSDYNDVDIGGCNVENVRMVKGRDDPTPAGRVLTTLVEVTDGRLTFNGDAGVDGGCWFTNWLKFEYKAPVGSSSWGTHWMPPPKPDPVWEQNVGSPVPIGLVTLQNFEWFQPSNSPVCSAWWLFKGSSCYPNKASGWFNESNQGAIIGVSNVSCLTGNCAGFVKCGEIRLAANLWDNRYFVDCNGKVGQYVSVKLPGSNRYFTVTVAAYLYAPLIPQSENPFVCYAVEARPSTTTSPEFVISNDPEDPIFYSTCYARNPNVIWLSVGAAAPEPDRWRFNGRCISCDSFKRNKAAKANFASLPVPWVVTDGQCVDCYDESNAPLNPVTTNWVHTYMSACDDPAKDTTNRGLPSCSGSGFDSCDKRLYARGRTENEPTWGSSVLTVTECQAIAARDPECSPTIHYYDGGGWTVCECHRAHPCCGVCTPSSWSQQGTTRTTDPKVSYQIYDRSVSPLPDAFCSSGIKSADNLLCCPNTCKDSTGKNVCGVQWQCSNAVGGASCCRGDNQVLIAFPCTAHGPPCTL